MILERRLHAAVWRFGRGRKVLAEQTHKGLLFFPSINLIRFLKSRREIHTMVAQLFASVVKSAALTWFIILLQRDPTCYDLIIKSRKIKYGNKLLEDL